MGCAASNDTPKKDRHMNTAERTMKAALLIQRWYRRYIARMEARRRATWSIFQSLEYAGEQDQLRLYNFFNDMMSHIHKAQLENNQGSSSNLLQALSYSPRPSSRLDSLEEEDAELYKLTDPRDVTIPLNYKGPHLKWPLTINQATQLIEFFKRKHVLHAKYVLQLLHETRRMLKKLPNINQVSTSVAQQVTICGDLHGKIDDLFIIFHKNGLPSASNPYLFNGDFVDRGNYSVEISILLFMFSIINPNSLYINRGNHEDHVMNLRYGFIKEVMTKYKEHATKVVRLFEDVFSWLPLATIIDQKVLVTHGGISDRTDLDYLAGIDRHKYLSVLRPPVLDEEEEEEEGKKSSADPNIDLKEWRQVLDILWSDPKPQMGCKPNTFRGGGSYFGPDVTKLVLARHKLLLLIRSHECRPEGYEYLHNNQVLTVFSASNYYEYGSNKAAYIKLGPDLHPHIVQYVATKTRHGQKLSIKQRVGMVEDSALRSLRQRIFSNKTALLEEFAKYDPANMGLMKVGDWCQSMADTLDMQELPWRSLRPKLAQLSDNGLVNYASTFEDFQIQNKLHEKEGEQDSTTTEAIYKNKDTLETIFRAIDKDNSGLISMQEFENACMILGQHAHSPIDKTQIHEMARRIDINNDGNIDFNEFLEAFRIVDKFGKEMEQENRLASPQITNGNEIMETDLSKGEKPSEDSTV